jgi:predicted nucleic acid-binding protein
VITIDSSVALAWYLERENAVARLALEAVVEGGAVVPGNFDTEVVHVLAACERRGRTTDLQTLRAIEDLRDLQLVTTMPPMALIAALARRHKLTGYEAAYLALAIERAAPLATLDKKLAAAAQNEKICWCAAQSQRD